MYTAAITYTPHLKRAMAFFAALTALSVFLYGIFLLEAVGNTAERTSAERQVHTLTTKVSTLEQAYLSATREMTLERAHAMGFITPVQVTTVFAVAGTRSLTFGGH
jgi:hypothetical protein